MGVSIELKKDWFDQGANIAKLEKEKYEQNKKRPDNLPYICRMYDAKQDLKKRLLEINSSNSEELENELAKIRALFPYRGSPYIENSTLRIDSKQGSAIPIGRIIYDSLPKRLKEN